MRRRLKICTKRLVAVLVAALWAVIFSGLAATGSQKVLTVSELIKNRKTLNGKTVTVRGLFHGESAAGGDLTPDFETRYLDNFSHSIRLALGVDKIHKHYGRLERSLVEATGTIWYFRPCDERIPYEMRAEPNSVPLCPVVSGVGMDSITDWKIIDTYGADDPRIPLHEPYFRKHPFVALPETDADYKGLHELGRQWRRAILDGDIPALVRLVDWGRLPNEKIKKKTAYLTDSKGRFYNAIFQGTDSLQHQIRQHAQNPFFIGVERQEAPHRRKDFARFSHVAICYCLRDACTDKQVERLKYFSWSSNLKDPFWCFTSEQHPDGHWVINPRP